MKRNVIAIDFKEIECNELLITELEKDNWFEVLEGGYLLVGKPVRMLGINYEDLFS